MKNPTKVALALDDIRIDGGTQPRTGINETVVQEYAEAMMAGDEFPPVDVFFDGSDRWLASGFHRYFGTKTAGFASVFAFEHKGTKRDALLFAVGTNDKHGLRRSPDDKRRAVRLLLEDEEWAQWSDREIARQCSVAHSFVIKVRGELKQVVSGLETRCDPGAEPETRKFERGGKVHEQIVKKAAPAQEPPQAEAPGEDGSEGMPSAAELLDDLHAELRASQARVAELEKALADGGKEHQLNLIRRLEHAERARDDAMASAVRSRARADYYEKLLARCGRAVGDRNLDQVAPKVEAMARQMRETMADG